MCKFIQLRYEVNFAPQQPLVIDTFRNCEDLSRVASMDGDGVVMLGQIGSQIALGDAKEERLKEEPRIEVVKDESKSALGTNPPHSLRRGLLPSSGLTGVWQSQRRAPGLSPQVGLFFSRRLLSQR